MTPYRPVRRASLAGWLLAAAVALQGAPTLGAEVATQAAPALALTALDGSEIHLRDLKGRVVLVDFWASWCVPCRVSFPALDGLYRELHARGLEVIAVNVDERGRDADEFLNAHPHTMPVFLDPKGLAAEAFRIAGMPTSILIDRTGQIRFTHMGYTTMSTEVYRREILALLEEQDTR
jgi:thiol-disulfide isomerase/thioredoxin